MYQKKLCTILCDILLCGKIADNDNFFSIGCDSIQAIEFICRIQDELGLKLELIDILKHPTVQALNEFLVNKPKVQLAAGITPLAQPQRASYMTSPIQRSLYLIDKMTNRQDISILPDVIEFDRELNPNFAKEAFCNVLQRHEILRTTFTLNHETLVQIVHPLEAIRCPFKYTDISMHEYLLQSLQTLYDAAAKEPFNLEAEPLVRFHLIKVSMSLYIVFLSIHHAISDGFSVTTIENDFKYFYDKAEGQSLIVSSSLNPQTLSFQYKDYVYWLNEWTESLSGKQSLKYWANTLVGYSKPNVFPGGTSRSVSFAAAREDSSVNTETLKKLQSVSAKYEVTLFVVLQCCIKLLLFLETGDTDIVVGVAVTTRDSIPLFGQIGPFVNTLPIRTKISSETTFEHLIYSVNNATLAAFAHKLIPLETLMEELTNGFPLFDVGFTLQKRNVPTRYASALTDCNKFSDSLGIKLLFIAYESPSTLDIRIRYQTAHFNQNEIVKMIYKLTYAIDKLCDSPDTKFCDLFELIPQKDSYVIDLDL